jgi:hypothetical protein
MSAIPTITRSPLCSFVVRGFLVIIAVAMIAASDCDFAQRGTNHAGD